MVLNSNSEVLSDTASLSQCSTTVASETPAPSDKTTHDKKASRNIFSRTKKEPLPQWKIDQQKKFKDWEKARTKQMNFTGVFTDFYKPSPTNKAWWIWWM
ncbi:hypothetical protein Slin15195_G007760 [Septoria linicola]|uniref:Uncharacterized protein n=1 Tax=Septoria linicola TaxID=215465 RepID=A0A9Q9AJY2_9PEZI|nr:hypothetical protein Slin14017_G007770 [Septoria linicola]USW47457.1 hypothetical protein Slin15195_G007760 [Septoria linicola]